MEDNRICKICLKSDDSIFCLDETHEATRILEECGNIKISANTFVCNKCINQLKEWDLFKKKITNAFLPKTNRSNCGDKTSTSIVSNNKENIPLNPSVKSLEIKTYSCWQCKSIFRNKVQYVQHCRSYHKPERLYCKFCQTAFKTNMQLRIHMETKCTQVKIKPKQHFQSVIHTRTKYLVAAAIQHAKQAELEEKEATDLQKEQGKSSNSSSSPSVIYTDCSGAS